jgi:hypothetical protein
LDLQGEKQASGTSSSIVFANRFEPAEADKLLALLIPEAER